MGVSLSQGSGGPHWVGDGTPNPQWPDVMLQWMGHGNWDTEGTGEGGSRSHGLRGNKDPSLPPQLDVHGRGDSNTHQPTRLAGNCLGRGLHPRDLSKEGGLAGDVPDSPSLTPGPYPSSTCGTHSRLGRPVHLRTLIATSLWMMIRHPPSGSHRFGKTAPQSGKNPF